MEFVAGVLGAKKMSKILNFPTLSDIMYPSYPSNPFLRSIELSEYGIGNLESVTQFWFYCNVFAFSSRQDIWNLWNF